jgi:serine/threonine protein phosphatase PrpC
MATRPPAKPRRRTRLARGPLTIGEPAPAFEPRLAGAEPYRPDSIADGGRAFGLTVRAASVRGLSKRYAGGDRQDDLCVRVHEPSRTLIVAVADGVSGAPMSGLGAALAVRHASAAVVRWLERSTRPNEHVDDRHVGDPDWRSVFEQAAWALVEQHRRDAGTPDAGVLEAASSLATTLLVAAITVDGEQAAMRVRLAAVGDSPALILRGGEFEAITHNTESADELLETSVRALPVAIDSVRERSCTLEPGTALLLCTDGLALPLAAGTGEVGETLARELVRPPDIVDFARLLDFSRSTYDDDRSLVAVWAAR